jgi:D-alanine-D-alanine ligase
VRQRIAIVYNEPQPSRYNASGEEAAVCGILEAVAAVQFALVEMGFEVTLTPLVPPLEVAAASIKSLDAGLVFNLFEGFCGQPETETFLPEVCAQSGLPYTGCPSEAIRLALHKVRAKIRLQECGIATPDFQLLSPHMLHLFRLGYPCIVKPLGEDASHGINAESVVYNPETLEKQVARVSAGYGGTALVEEFAGGHEFSATVLGCSVLPVSEIAYSLPPGMPHLLTYDAKWQPQSLYYKGSSVVCPANISEEERRQVAHTAQAAFEAIGCRGYTRVDMRIDKKGDLKVIEVNPNPDISPRAGAARQAEAAGMGYTEFIEKIVTVV